MENIKEFYYTDGKSQYGPFSISELSSMNMVTRDTMVWHDQLENWKPAKEVPELAELFKYIPPPLEKEKPKEMTIMPKTWLVESILVTIFCCWPFGIAGIVNASKVETRWRVGDKVGAKRASEEAKRWTLIGFWLTMGIVILYILFFAVIIGSGGRF
jgi:hypothetical protein